MSYQRFTQTKPVQRVLMLSPKGVACHVHKRLVVKAITNANYTIIPLKDK